MGHILRVFAGSAYGIILGFSPMDTSGTNSSHPWLSIQGLDSKYHSTTIFIPLNHRSKPRVLLYLFDLMKRSWFVHSMHGGSMVTWELQLNIHSCVEYTGMTYNQY